jgi:hypothetical protein
MEYNFHQLFGRNTEKPLINSTVDPLASGRLQSRSAQAKTHHKETGEGNILAALEVFMDANTDDKHVEEALKCWEDHKGCPLPEDSSMLKNHSMESRELTHRCFSGTLNR